MSDSDQLTHADGGYGEHWPSCNPCTRITPRGWRVKGLQRATLGMHAGG